MPDAVIVAHAGRHAVITLNRPAKLNAVLRQSADQLPIEVTGNLHGPSKVLALTPDRERLADLAAALRAEGYDVVPVAETGDALDLLVVSVEPSCAISSASCSAVRVAVPSSNMAMAKLARPGAPTGFASLPVLTTRLAATKGNLACAALAFRAPRGSSVADCGVARGPTGPKSNSWLPIVAAV